MKVTPVGSRVLFSTKLNYVNHFMKNLYVKEYSFFSISSSREMIKCVLQSATQIANIIGSTLHIDWVIGVWLRSHVHDWANVGVIVHSHAIFADAGPIMANDLILQRIIKVIFFQRNKSGPIFVSHCNKS